MHSHQKKAKVTLPLPLKTPIGAGDVVKKVTEALGIKTCGACEERRQRMNQALAFGRKSSR